MLSLVFGTCLLPQSNLLVVRTGLFQAAALFRPSSLYGRAAPPPIVLIAAALFTRLEEVKSKAETHLQIETL